MRQPQIWILSLALVFTSVIARESGNDHLLQAFEEWLKAGKEMERISESADQAERSLIGSLIGSLAVNSPGERGVLSTLFPTLFPAATNSSLNQGMLDRIFSNSIKAQILQAEADYINLNNANNALAAQTAVLTAWKSLCNATAGTTRNLTTGLYYFESNLVSVRNWFGARNLCRSKGMDLLNVEDATEAAVVSTEILRILNQTGAVTDAATNVFWIGLNAVANAGTTSFTWDGAQTGPPVSFIDWHAGQPLVDVANAAQCVQITQRNGVLRWFSVSCTNTARFICEMPEPCKGILRA